MPHTVTVTSSLGATRSNEGTPRQSPEDYVERPQNYPEKQRRLEELKKGGPTKKVTAMKNIVPQNPGTVAIVTGTQELESENRSEEEQVIKGVIDKFFYTVEGPAETRLDGLLMYGEKPLADVREQVTGVPFVAGVLQPSLQEVQSIRDTGQVPERAKKNLSGAAGASFGGTGLILLAGVAFAGYQASQ